MVSRHCLRTDILHDSNAWHWTDIKSLECLSVYLSEIPIVHDSDCSFCPILIKFEMSVTHLTTKTKFDGQ